MNTFLSIYVPTYKRVQQFSSLVSLLDKEIDSYFSSNPDRCCAIEVVASCSNPPDLDVLRRSLQGLRNQKLFRVISPQDVVSGSVNVVAGSSLCCGSYVWVFCDDDVPKKGSLACLVGILQSFVRPPSLLYLEPDFLKPKLHLGEYFVEGVYHPGYVFSAYENSRFSFDGECSVSEMNDEWLAGNVDELLRASSLVFRRSDTHCFWLSTVRDTYVTPLALALDAFRNGDSYVVHCKLYFYLEFWLNKKSWSPKWLIIKYLELYPLAINFLFSKGIIPDPRFFRLSVDEIMPFILSSIKFPALILKRRSIRQIIRYASTFLSSLFQGKAYS